MGQIRGVGQQPRKQVDQQRQPVSLVATDRQQKAIERNARIRRRTSLRIGRPAIRYGFASLEGITDLCPRDDAHRHIQQEGFAARIRNPEAQRAIAKPGIAAPPGRNGGGRVAADDARIAMLRGDERVW